MKAGVVAKSLHWCKLVVMATIPCQGPFVRQRELSQHICFFAQLISSCLQQEADGSKNEKINFLKSKCLFYSQVCFLIQNKNKNKNRPLAVSEDAKILKIWDASLFGEIASIVNL